ncbi:hypothetical protein V1517DRAFT_368406 [Lipomyces orientalis]|uniref:Uncharacterized protein n=1 Tax=Lipomyces orientalis TaxID=1233043 RepID=A0ACC3TMT2_9ASCO
MHVRALSLFLALATATLVRALFADEAFVVDWHIASIGSIAPSRALVSPDSVTVFSESSVLASLDTVNGTVRWRHLLDESAVSQHSHLTRLDSSAVLLVAATPADAAITHVAAWFEDSGYLIWDAYLSGGAPVGVSVAGDVYILLSGGKIQRLSRSTGSVVGEYSLPDGYSPVDIVASKDSISVITRKQDKGLGYFVLTGGSGELADDTYILIDKNPAAVSVTKAEGYNSNIIAWTVPGEFMTIKIAGMSGTSAQPLTVTPKAPYASFSLTSSTSGVVATITGIDGKSWTETYIFSRGKLTLVGATDPTESALAVSDGTLFKISKTSISSFALTTTGAKLASNTEIQLPPSSVEFAKCGSSACLVGFKNGEYVLATTTTGVAWTRDESIADVVSALFVDLEEEGESSSLGEVLFEENAAPLQAYIHRVRRHWKALAGLPQYLIGFFQRFLSGDYDAVPVDPNSTVSDTFGFRKFVVLATTRGSLRALDTAHAGAFAWKVDDVLESDAIVGIVQGDAKDELYVVGAFGTVAYVNALTGKVMTISKIADFGLGDKVESVVAFVHDGVQYIAAWTAHGQLHFLKASSPATSIYFSKVIDNVVAGYVFKEDRLIPTWQFTLPTSYKISSFAARHPGDKTVSLGRVLGDRSVLYKYLNPHILAVAAVDDTTKSAAVFLIDDVSGRLLYSSFHENEAVDTAAGVKLVVGEHWVVYSYWSDLPARGEKLVVLDMYESDIKNERWSKDQNFSSFTETPLPFVQGQAYLFPEHITSLAVSRSRFGITNRDIIATLDTAQIAVLPKRLLDARRPINRDPTNDEKEEGLVKYDALIGEDKRFIVSHVYNVLGTKKTICSPAYLESTVLVFAYGLDLFFTRITPSQPFDLLSKSFNKGQLLLTIFALMVGVRFTSPIVKRKQLNMRWGTQK